MGIPGKEDWDIKLRKKNAGGEGREKGEDEILSWLSRRDRRNPIGNGG
jgi:hypothetical protein